jgi:hypothetical protein
MQLLEQQLVEALDKRAMLTAQTKLDMLDPAFNVAITKHGLTVTCQDACQPIKFSVA